MLKVNSLLSFLLSFYPFLLPSPSFLFPSLSFSFRLLSSGAVWHRTSFHQPSLETCVSFAPLFLPLFLSLSLSLSFRLFSLFESFSMSLFILYLCPFFWLLLLLLLLLLFVPPFSLGSVPSANSPPPFWRSFASVAIDTFQSKHQAKNIIFFCFVG